jgi:hypothetical protein
LTLSPMDKRFMWVNLSIVVLAPMLAPTSVSVERIHRYVVKI